MDIESMRRLRQGFKCSILWYGNFWCRLWYALLTYDFTDIVDRL